MSNTWNSNCLLLNFKKYDFAFEIFLRNEEIVACQRQFVELLTFILSWAIRAISVIIGNQAAVLKTALKELCVCSIGHWRHSVRETNCPSEFNPVCTMSVYIRLQFFHFDFTLPTATCRCSDRPFRFCNWMSMWNLLSDANGCRQIGQCIQQRQLTPPMNSSRHLNCCN